MCVCVSKRYPGLKFVKRREIQLKIPKKLASSCNNHPPTPLLPTWRWNMKSEEFCYHPGMPMYWNISLLTAIAKRIKEYLELVKTETWSKSWKIKPQKRSCWTWVYFAQKKELKTWERWVWCTHQNWEQNGRVHTWICNWSWGLSNTAWKDGGSVLRGTLF